MKFKGFMKENIIAIVGFLGVGKTTLLKKLIKDSLEIKLQPYLVLNDYENANIDAEQFLSFLNPEQVNAMSGSCICCSGISELRLRVNNIPKRKNGVTFIEANGTTDACDLMSFLSVGLNEQVAPPLQISVVDVRGWQKRGEHNDLEASQVQVSSLVVLNHVENVSKQRIQEVEQQIRLINPYALIENLDNVFPNLLKQLKAVENDASIPEHHRYHWSSCSVDLPDPIYSSQLSKIIQSLPPGIIRVKGCTKLDSDSYYSHIEKIPSGEVFVKPYNGEPVTGPKLIVVGPGSDPHNINSLIKASVSDKQQSLTLQ